MYWPRPRLCDDLFGQLSKRSICHFSKIATEISPIIYYHRLNLVFARYSLWQVHR